MKTKVRPISLGVKVKFYRERTGLSQLQLALRCNLAYGTIGAIELNKKRPSVKTLHTIGYVLNLNVKELSFLLGVNLYIDEEVKKLTHKRIIGNDINTTYEPNKYIR